MLKRYKNFIKFGVVAGIYNVLSYSVYAFLIFTKCHYIIASTISFVVGVSLSYFMNKIIVFKHTQKHSRKVVIRYVTFYLVLLAINLILLRIFVAYLGINAYLAQLIVVVACAVLSYNTMRKFIFTF